MPDILCCCSTPPGCYLSTPAQIHSAPAIFYDPSVGFAESMNVQMLHRCCIRPAQGALLADNDALHYSSHGRVLRDLVGATTYDSSAVVGARLGPSSRPGAAQAAGWSLMVLDFASPCFHRAEAGTAIRRPGVAGARVRSCWCGTVGTPSVICTA